MAKKALFDHKRFFKREAIKKIVRALLYGIAKKKRKTWTEAELTDGSFWWKNRILFKIRRILIKQKRKTHEKENSKKLFKKQFAPVLSKSKDGEEGEEKNSISLGGQ